MKHLMNLGQMWSKYLPLATVTYNTFNTANLANFSPYESVFGRKPKLLLNLDITSNMKVLGTFFRNTIMYYIKDFNNYLRHFRS